MDGVQLVSASVSSPANMGDTLALRGHHIQYEARFLTGKPCCSWEPDQPAALQSPDRPAGVDTAPSEASSTAHWRILV